MRKLITEVDNLSKADAAYDLGRRAFAASEPITAVPTFGGNEYLRFRWQAGWARANHEAQRNSCR